MMEDVRGKLNGEFPRKKPR